MGIEKITAPAALTLAKEIQNTMPMTLDFTFNLKNGLAQWRSERDKVASGQNIIVDVNVIGDSISEGAYATSWATQGYLGLLRSYFTSQYGDVGRGFIPVYYPSDPSVFMVLTGSWSNDTLGVNGGSKRTTTVNNYATLTFSGTGIEIWYAKRNNLGDFSVAIDGGAEEVVSAYSASLVPFAIKTITGLQDTTHTVVIKNLGAGLCLIGAREIKGSKGIRLNTCARWGITTNYTIASSSLSVLSNLAPKLSIIALLANDSNAQTALATYLSEMQTIITNAKVSGDVLLVANGIHNPNTSPITENSYADVLVGLAIKNNCAYVNINKQMSDNGAIANSLGYLHDNVHPNNAGHQFIYNIIKNILLL